MDGRGRGEGEKIEGREHRWLAVHGKINALFFRKDGSIGLTGEWWQR